MSTTPYIGKHRTRTGHDTKQVLQWLTVTDIGASANVNGLALSMWVAENHLGLRLDRAGIDTLTAALKAAS